MERQSYCPFIVVILLAGLAQAQGKSWTAIPVGRADYQIWNGDCQLFDLKTKVNVYVAASIQDQKLADANQVVIMTLARTANQGDILEETEMAPLVRGRRDSRARTPEDKRADYLANPRLLVEPVKAIVTLKWQDSCRVYALDHDGCKPAAASEIKVENTRDGQRFTLDGRQTRAMYYLVDFER